MAKKAVVEVPPEPVKPKRGRPPSGIRKPDASVILTCNWEWKAALSTAARREGLSLSDLIARAVNEHETGRGKQAMPPRISTDPPRPPT